MIRALASRRSAGGAGFGLRSVVGVAAQVAAQAEARVPRGRLIVALLIIAGVPLMAADANVLAGDGTQAKGTATSDGRTLSVGTAAITIDRLIAARFTTSAAAVSSNVDQGVVLADGDVVAGVVVAVQNGQMEVASDRFGSRSLPLANVAGLILAPQSITVLARIGDEPAGGRFLNGDRLVGTVAFLNPVAAGINNGKRIIELPRERLALVRTSSAMVVKVSAKDSATSSAIQRVRLITGERLSGVLLKLDKATLTLKHAALGELKIPLALVASLWSDGGALTPLTTLSATVTQAGFLGPAALPRANGAGNDGPLPVAGGTAEQVLRVQARCDLAYSLDGTSDALVSEVALDPRASSRGDAIVRVLGDDKVLAEIALADGNPHVLNVPLTGVRKLVLQTDTGPDGVTTGDLVTWSWPVLVRGAPTAAR